MRSDEIKSCLDDLGSIVPTAMTPSEVDQYYEVQRETWIPVVRATGARREQ